MYVLNQQQQLCRCNMPALTWTTSLIQKNIPVQHLSGCNMPAPSCTCSWSHHRHESSCTTSLLLHLWAVHWSLTSLCALCAQHWQVFSRLKQHSRCGHRALFRPSLVREGVYRGPIPVWFLGFKHEIGNIEPSERAISKILALHRPMRGLQWSVWPNCLIRQVAWFGLIWSTKAGCKYAKI